MDANNIDYSDLNESLNLRPNAKKQKEVLISFVVFKENDYLYAFPADYVQHILTCIDYRKIPNLLNSSIKGISNINKSASLVIDLKSVLNLKPNDNPSSTTLILKHESDFYAFPVDHLIKIKGISPSLIKPIDTKLSKDFSKFLLSYIELESETIYILDHQLIISSFCNE